MFPLTGTYLIISYIYLAFAMLEQLYKKYIQRVDAHTKSTYTVYTLYRVTN